MRKGNLKGVAGCVDEGDVAVCIGAGLQVDAATSRKDGHCSLDGACRVDHSELGRARLHNTARACQYATDKYPC